MFLPFFNLKEHLYQPLEIDQSSQLESFDLICELS